MLENFLFFFIFVIIFYICLWIQFLFILILLSFLLRVEYESIFHCDKNPKKINWPPINYLILLLSFKDFNIFISVNPNYKEEVILDRKINSAIIEKNTSKEAEFLMKKSDLDLMRLNKYRILDRNKPFHFSVLEISYPYYTFSYTKDVYTSYLPKEKEDEVFRILLKKALKYHYNQLANSYYLMYNYKKLNHLYVDTSREHLDRYSFIISKNAFNIDGEIIYCLMSTDYQSFVRLANKIHGKEEKAAYTCYLCLNLYLPEKYHSNNLERNWDRFERKFLDVVGKELKDNRHVYEAVIDSCIKYLNKYTLHKEYNLDGSVKDVKIVIDRIEKELNIKI